MKLSTETRFDIDQKNGENAAIIVVLFRRRCLISEMPSLHHALIKPSNRCLVRSEMYCGQLLSRRSHYYRSWTHKNNRLSLE